MLFRIDPDSEVPLFAQLAATVRGAIARGRLVAGERLPAARDVAASLEINLHTVLRAYQDLRDDGLVELRRGRGAVVIATAGRDRELLGAIADLVATAQARDMSRETLLALIREEYR